MDDMRLHHLLAAVVMMGVFATGASAQDTGQAKPGGLNKVARNISKTAKKAGRDTKAEVKRASSGAHRALTANGIEAKEKAKAVTGITTPAPDSAHKPGGVNKLARDVSHASKKAGAKTKHAVKKTASRTHQELTKAGKTVKDTIKR
jgi:hypothetical protein